MAKISERNLGQTGERSHLRKWFKENVYGKVKRKGKAKK